MKNLSCTFIIEEHNDILITIKNTKISFLSKDLYNNLQIIKVIIEQEFFSLVNKECCNLWKIIKRQISYLLINYNHVHEQL